MIREFTLKADYEVFVNKTGKTIKFQDLAENIRSGACIDGFVIKYNAFELNTFYPSTIIELSLSEDFPVENRMTFEKWAEIGDIILQFSATCTDTIHILKLNNRDLVDIGQDNLVNLDRLKYIVHRGLDFKHAIISEGNNKDMVLYPDSVCSIGSRERITFREMVEKFEPPYSFKLYEPHISDNVTPKLIANEEIVEHFLQQQPQVSDIPHMFMEVPIFRQAFYTILTDNAADINTVTGDKDFENPDTKFHCMTTASADTIVISINEKSKPCYGDVAHECVHAAKAVVDNIGERRDTDELEAYLTGWFFAQISNFLNSHKIYLHKN